MEELLAADHVFLTNFLMSAVPAVSLDDAQLGYDSAFCDKINEAVFDEAELVESQQVSRVVLKGRHLATG